MSIPLFSKCFVSLFIHLKKYKIKTYSYIKGTMVGGTESTSFFPFCIISWNRTKPKVQHGRLTWFLNRCFSLLSLYIIASVRTRRVPLIPIFQGNYFFCQFCPLEGSSVLQFRAPTCCIHLLLLQLSFPSLGGKASHCPIFFFINMLYTAIMSRLLTEQSLTAAT